MAVSRLVSKTPWIISKMIVLCLFWSLLQAHGGRLSKTFQVKKKRFWKFPRNKKLWWKKACFLLLDTCVRPLSKRRLSINSKAVLRRRQEVLQCGLLWSTHMWWMNHIKGTALCWARRLFWLCFLHVHSLTHLHLGTRAESSDLRIVVSQWQHKDSEELFF